MAGDDYAWLDATAQAELVASNEVKPEELVDAAVDRLEALDPQLGVLVTPLFDKAREAARGLVPSGPFRGVPMLLKDLGAHSAGDPLYEGSAFLRNARWTEPEDSYLVRSFREAGLIILGKSKTPEFGLVSTTEPAAFGPARNPWDPSCGTGGSSGGSAAAVAAGLVPVAHANDGGGSIRIPAAMCGVVGLKPSRGRTSLGPHFGDMLGGLVVEHVVTRSVRDTARMLDAVAGPWPGDPFVAPQPTRRYADEVDVPPGNLRVGMMTTSPSGNAAPDPEAVTAVTNAGRLLESLGHVVESSYPDVLDDPGVTEHFVTSWAAGQAWTVDYWTRLVGRPPQPDELEPTSWALTEFGRSVTAPMYLSSREWLQKASRRLATWWSSGFDLLVTPTCAEPPPTLGQFVPTEDNVLAGLFRSTPFAQWTAAFNVSGQPAISLPLHWTGSGLPMGVQLVAAYGREDLLVRVAAQLETAQPWAHRRPPAAAS
jgi:amidase